MIRFLRPLLAIVGICALFTLMYVETTDARVRSGAGSRGSRTFTPPPKTNTAPGTAQPIQRSTTPAQPSAAGRTAAPAATGAAARPGLFNRPGFMGGLVAGLLGAGLIGLLFGQGLLGNLAGFASILGLLLQVALIGGIGFLLFRWWQSRSQPQPALAGIPAGDTPRAYGAAPSAESPAPPPAPLQNSNPRPGYGGGDAHSGATNGHAEPVDEIRLKPEDYDAFERLLGEIQTYYSKEDVAALRQRTTPEMMTYLSEDLGENLSRGVTAALSRVKLLQGDLAEAWAEGNVEYATVALRYELIDTVVDRNTRQVIEGDPDNPVEATELWTFMRSRNGGTWLLSAIQQMDEEGDDAQA
jgi:predicted lipid-binding transport protein (Tim44 family)